MSLHIIHHQGVEGSRRASGLSGDLGSLLTSVSLSGPWACGAVIYFQYPYSLPGCWSQCKPLLSSPCSHLRGLLFSSAFSKLCCLSMRWVVEGRAQGCSGILFCFSSPGRASVGYPQILCGDNSLYHYFGCSATLSHLDFLGLCLESRFLDLKNQKLE